MKKLVAWGKSKLLQIYLRDVADNPFAYIIDDLNGENLKGIPTFQSSILLKEKLDDILVVIFAASSNSLQAISQKLSFMGLEYNKHYIYYSDFLKGGFTGKLAADLGWDPDEELYKYALGFTLNSRKPVHTTILGNWLFLEAMNRAPAGSIAEIGAFEGGNAFCALNRNPCNASKYYIVDSFEGFPTLSDDDPKQCKKGDYNISTTLNQIMNDFRLFPNALVIKGFVPDVFACLDPHEKYSLVFYDCDLYQPALDTYKYFWDKLVPGGFLLIHDYEYEPNGFSGVSKATQEFFAQLNVKITVFPENTMAVIVKP